jgi:pilus biogenesis lipoprotein CpaD
MVKTGLFWSDCMFIRKTDLLYYILIFPFLASCSPSYDLQGLDPQEYYAAHPRENQVESRHSVYIIRFEGGAGLLSASEVETLRGSLDKLNPHAVEEVNIISAQPKNARVKQVAELLRSYKFPTPLKFARTKDENSDKLVIDITYAAVVPPDCPDWKLSPVTTYSNSPAPNFGCASTVNLGLMVDNPHDLEQGRNSRVSRTERSSKVIHDYRAGTAAAPASMPASAAPAPAVSATGQ